MCPHCHQNAPIIYRGVVPYCTACNARRAPLSGASVNLAGKPAKLGGTVAGALGILVLLGGSFLALTLGLLLGALTSTAVGLAVGLPLGLLTLSVGLVLLLGGRSLWRTGKDAAARTHTQAIFALANTRGGVLRASDVAQALGIPEEQADLELTALAKRDIDRVTLELDESGAIFYRFPEAIRARIAEGVGGEPRYRVGVRQPGSTSAEDAVQAEAEAEAEAAIRGPRAAAHGRV